MDKSQVLIALQKVFDDTFMDEVVVTESLSAKDVEEWDSLSHISLVLAVEETFNIRFRVGEVESTKNVGELADLIARRKGGP